MSKVRSPKRIASAVAVSVLLSLSLAEGLTRIRLQTLHPVR